MKKRILLAMLALFVFLQSAAAQNSASYERITPAFTYIDGTGNVREGMLHASLYVSDDELWFSGTADEGGPWILKTNVHGEILEHRTLAVLPEELVFIQCMHKTKHGLMLGMIDFVTTLGKVGIMTSDGQVSYTDLGDTKIFHYSPVEGGMLAQGIVYDANQNTHAPQTIYVNTEGEIVFQKTGKANDLDVDGGALSSSLCCASGDQIYVMEAQGLPSSVLAQRELACFDLNGNEKWRLKLDAGVVPQIITAADNSIYLLGFIGEWNAEEMLVRQQAMVQCYSDDGIYQWTETFDSPNQFQRGSAGLGACVAANMVEGWWYVVVLDTQGAIQKMITISAEGQYISSLTILSDHRVIVLGMSWERLLLCNIGY